MTTTIRQPQQQQNLAKQPQPASRLLALVWIISILVAAVTAVLAIQMILSRAPIVSFGQEIELGNLSLMVESAGWLAHDHSAHDHGDEGAAPSGSGQDNALQQDVADQNEEIRQLTEQGAVFPMPDNMMPDMPAEGQQRLQVEFILRNPGKQPRNFGAEEFQLHSAGGDTWFPRVGGSSFRPGTLGPGQTLSAVIFFDVEETATDLYLVWNRDGSWVRIPVNDPLGR